MWAVELNFFSVFCISAVSVFFVSLAFMMLIVYMRRGRSQQTQSQGTPCSVVYAPTTIQNLTISPDVKPLLVASEKSQLNMYPVKELALLKENCEEA